MFDWINFLTRYDINYVTGGKNTSRNHVSIACPWCQDDPSEHLGISLQHGGYSCWRDPSHRGGRPHNLVMALLHCSYVEAAAIVGDETPLTSEDTFLASVNALAKTPLQGRPAQESPKAALCLPASFRPISSQEKGLMRLACSYLQMRGYDPAEIDDLAETYNLHFTTTGPFAHRIIIPIYMPYGLATWTGRAIQKSIRRYKTLSVDEEKAKAEKMPIALDATTNLLFNYPDLLKSKADKLYLVEGPFDSMKLDFYGRQYGIRATCLFTKQLGNEIVDNERIFPAQLELLMDLSANYKQKYLLLDNNVGLGSTSLINKLEPLGFKKATLPANAKDPAVLSAEQIYTLTLGR